MNFKQLFKLLLFVFFCFSPLTGFTASPELPRVTVNTALPSSALTCTTTLNTGDNLQLAIDNAVLGDTICLQAGSVFTGYYDLKNKTSGSGWITIRTTNYAGLPAVGNRVNPSHAGVMAKISTPISQAAFTALSKAHHYRLIGLEITGTNVSTNLTVIDLIRVGSGETSVSDVPNNIIIDRCYIHGTATGNYRRGVTLGSATTAIVDSYISNIHEVGADSQAVSGWNGPGPYNIQNNYLEAAGENVMFGGAEQSIPGNIPADIEIKNNYFFKPLSWKIGHFSYAGIPWTVKNLFELKFARRVLVEGNIFENSWIEGQTGFAWNIKSSVNITEHVTLQNNITRNTVNGVVLCGLCDGATDRMNNILIQNNVFENISGYTDIGEGHGTGMSIANSINALTIDHNTILNTGNPLGFTGNPHTNFVFQNNILGLYAYGVKGDGTSAGNPTLSVYTPNGTFLKNILIGSGLNYPADNSYPSVLSDVGFTNFSGGNYLLTPSSPYKNTGTDSKDPGADISALLAATATVISGNNGGLPPPPDTTPPVLSGISAGSITNNSAIVTWTTNESSDTQVEYGLTTSYGSASTLNSSFVTSHTVTLSSLTPNTLYHYRVKSRDAAGNLAISTNQTFTTPPVVTSGVDPTLNVTTKDFGSLPVSSSTQAFMFFVNNPSSSFVGVSAVAVTGDFSVTTNYCNFGMQPATHCDIYVTFTPSTSGTRTGTLTITLTGSSLTSLSANLTGVGTTVNPPVTPPVTPPTLPPSPPSIKPVPIVTPPQTIQPIIITKVLARGMTSPYVIILQNHLKQLGLLDISIETTSYFGPATEAAVKRYQASKNIEQTGTVGPLTRASLAGSSLSTLPTQTTTSQVLPKTVYLGMQHSDVVKLQNILKRLGFFPQSVASSGYFGSETKKAVKKFQKTYGIASSGTESTTGYGMVGKKTWTKLLSL